MSEKFSTDKNYFLNRWIYATEKAGIPCVAYNPKIRLIKDEQDKLEYSFGALFNPNGFNRPFNTDSKSESCPMCFELIETNTKPYKDLAPGISENFLITYNAFPHLIGSSIAIARNVNGKEKPMYTTSNLNGLKQELDELFSIADEIGLMVFHNNFGAGASIPNHEHWHLLNFGAAYDKVGKMYGFDAAEKIQSKKLKQIKIMPSFPFAHLIFNVKDSELLVGFLNKMGRELGKKYPYDHVPHSICQGKEGVLVVPNKIHREKCLGSSDVAGHYLDCRSIEEFEDINFVGYRCNLEEILYIKVELDLESFPNYAL